MRFSLSDDALDDEEDSQVEVEPSHPIGFPSPYGKTWISLDPPTPSAVKAAIGRTTYGLFDSDSEDDEDGKKENRYVQSFPPLSSYVRAETVPTSALLSAERHARSRNKRNYYPRLESQEENDDLYYSGDDEDDENDVDAVSLLMRQPPASRSAPPEIPDAIKEALSSPTPSQRSEIQRNIQAKVDEERRRIDEECRRNTEALSALVMKSENEAAVILTKKQAHEAQLRREQEARDEQERQAQEARDAQVAKAQKEKQRQEALQKQQDEQQQQAQKAAEKKSREQAELAEKKTEHVDRAKKLVRQLVQLRASIQPFDENKAVSKRRLGMKKIARGKLNTLSENAQKVQEVATEVSQAITVMRQEDKNVAEGIQRGDPSLTQDMTRGKRYFLDLLASNAMSRVQAETFNAIKGDAFPLAGMLCLVSIENKDLNPILEAHIYTVCPTAIPVLPAPKHDASEDEVMTELGMQRKKEGEFESFPQFLARTENVISFMADIMSSVPSTHTLMKGNHGAIVWLERFLDLLPPAPTAPLPLITAPVLGAFLNGAGHMLANKHADAFKTLLAIITDDIVNRLDEGEVGKPSATRLNKLLAGGFEQFRKELPAKALPELYYGASNESKCHADGSVFGGTIGREEEAQPSQQLSISSQNPFGATSQQSQSSFGGQSQRSFGGPNQQSQSPFGVNSSHQSQGFASGQSTSKRGPCKFFAQGNCRNGDNCPFSHETGNGAPSSSEGSGFGSTPAANPFGGATSSGFSASSFVSTRPVGANATAGNPAGASASPFGSGSNTATPFATGGASASPFGSGSNTATPFAIAGAPVSPFGSGSNTTTPFGTTATPSSQSPFSGSAPLQCGLGSSNPSPFSSSQPAVQQSPFGAPSGNRNPSPFGGGSGASSFFGAGNTSKPFGSSNATNASPIGGGSTTFASPFGAGSNTQTFGASSNANPSPFGGGASNAAPSPFSNQSQSPFGKVSQPFGSVGNTHPSPFGGGAAPSPSPFSNPTSSSFGASNSSSPFGASGNTNPSPFGGRNLHGFGSSTNANPSPFSGNTPFGGSSGFGENSQQSQGFGGNGGKSNTPCRFFAQGRCRNGANCKFSHDTSGNNSGFGGGSNNGFGNSNNRGFGDSSSSGFGGGSNSGFGGSGGFGSGGGFGTSTLFGGPRR